MDIYTKPSPQGTEPLTTERLNLRKFKEYDAGAVLEWANDPGFLRYFNSAPPKNIDEARCMVQSWRAQYSAPNYLKWCMALADGNDAIGEISASIDEGLSRSEIEYVVSPSARGNGYAAEALSAVIRYLHDDVGIHRVVALVNVSNFRSSKTAEKAGMELEGIMRGGLVDRDGKFYDVVMFSHVVGDLQ